MGPSSLLFLFLCLRLMSCVIARTHEVQRNVGPRRRPSYRDPKQIRVTSEQEVDESPPLRKSPGTFHTRSALDRLDRFRFVRSERIPSAGKTQWLAHCWTQPSTIQCGLRAGEPSWKPHSLIGDLRLVGDGSEPST